MTGFKPPRDPGPVPPELSIAELNEPVTAAEAKAWLTACGACDAGLPMRCTCPSGDPRDVIWRLWAELIPARETLAGITGLLSLVEDPPEQAGLGPEIGVAQFPVAGHCRVCDCTDDHACDNGCYWVTADLCSVCDRDGVRQIPATRDAE